MKVKHKNLYIFVFILIILCLTAATTVPAYAPVSFSNSSPYCMHETAFGCQDQAQTNLWSIEMNNPRDGPSKPDFLFKKREIQWRNLKPDEELLQLEAELRQRQLWHRQDIKRWYNIACCGGKYNQAYAIEKLKLAIEGDRIETMRYPDDAAFRPLGPEVLLRQGDLHLLNQVIDGVPWMIPRDALVRGTFIAGPQGAGKSRFIVWICHQLTSAKPPIPFLIIDPKAALAPYADYLDACVIDISEISLDLYPPGNMTYPRWLTEYLPCLAADLGLVQSTALLLDAGRIAIELRDRFIKETGKHTELCLRDIYTCLSAVRDIERGRRLGYFEAVHTALSRVLLASEDLFSCRRGVPITSLCNTNIILTTGSLTDLLACRVFAAYLLAWNHANARKDSEINQLCRLIVIDDAQRYLSARIGQSDPSLSPTSMTQILAVLRSSGTGLMVASQLPAHVDPGVIALSNLVVVIGGVHDVNGQEVIGNAISLSSEQRKALVRLTFREAVGFYGAGAYRRPVHGWTVDVPDPERL